MRNVGRALETSRARPKLVGRIDAAIEEGEGGWVIGGGGLKLTKKMMDELLVCDDKAAEQLLR